jgi:hypothetical protein
LRRLKALQAHGQGVRTGGEVIVCPAHHLGMFPHWPPTGVSGGLLAQRLHQGAV